MGLFAQDDSQNLDDMPQRMALTRERGTRKLVIAFIIVLATWFVVGRVWDLFLLQRRWPPIAPDPQGLTIVGTLDSRGAYDRNMFKIIQANETARVELTDQGWRSIFDPANGGLCKDVVGNTIRGVISVDGETGYAMLEPFLRFGIESEMRGKNLGSAPTADTLIDVHRSTPTGPVVEQHKLGDLLKQFADKAEKGGGSSDEGDPGMSDSRDTDNGLTIPADTLARVCPTVLSGRQFTHADIDTEPATVVQKETYTVGLNLTPEGRSRFFRWSHDHSRESVIFILHGRVAAAARVNEPMDVNYWEVGPLLDKEAATDLVAFVKSHRT